MNLENFEKLVDLARERGAVIRAWRENDGQISRVLVRSGVPGMPASWISATDAVDRLREFVAQGK